MTKNQWFYEFNRVNMSLLSDTLKASAFGVKADYNGNTGTDNRNALQKAINYCSVNRKVLKLPTGRILVNSFSNSSAAKAHGNILELKSNLKITGNKSEIVVGNFFNDKNFIVISGFNTPQPSDFEIINNVSIKNITINFNAAKSIMKTKYRLRKGIEMGHTINGEISFCKFYNGDISCGIATGFGRQNYSTNIKIHHNEFQNLAFSKQNIDHTSVYLNSTNSLIYKNKFKNSLVQGKLVSCAAELHNSNTAFTDNEVVGYTRMIFLAAASTENRNISNLKVDRNQANITNAAIYLWTDEETSIKNVTISNNKVTCSHVPGYPMLYNGTQGLLADSKIGEKSEINDLTATNNIINISHTEIPGRSVMYSIQRKENNWKIIDNKCNGCKSLNY